MGRNAHSRGAGEMLLRATSIAPITLPTGQRFFAHHDDERRTGFAIVVRAATVARGVVARQKSFAAQNFLRIFFRARARSAANVAGGRAGIILRHRTGLGISNGAGGGGCPLVAIEQSHRAGRQQYFLAAGRVFDHRRFDFAGSLDFYGPTIAFSAAD
jgi:hypothetical protein